MIDPTPESCEACAMAFYAAAETFLAEGKRYHDMLQQVTQLMVKQRLPLDAFIAVALLLREVGALVDIHAMAAPRVNGLYAALDGLREKGLDIGAAALLRPIGQRREFDDGAMH